MALLKATNDAPAAQTSDRDKPGPETCALLFRGSVALAGAICRPVFDTFGIRFVFVWLGVFMVIGLFLMWWLYADRKRLGGDKHYCPPATG